MTQRNYKDIPSPVCLFLPKRRTFKAGRFLSLEGMDSLIQQLYVENSKFAKRLKIANLEPRNLGEKNWLHIANHVCKAFLPVVCQVHKHWNSREKL